MNPPVSLPSGPNIVLYYCCPVGNKIIKHLSHDTPKTDESWNTSVCMLLSFVYLHTTKGLRKAIIPHVCLANFPAKFPAILNS